MEKREGDGERGRDQIHIHAHAIGRIHVCLAVHVRGPTGIRVGGVYCAGRVVLVPVDVQGNGRAGMCQVLYVSGERTPLRGQPGWDYE